AINLQDAISRAVRFNLDVQSAQLTPAITEAQVVIAEAAFDWTLFADFNASDIDQPNPVTLINGIPVASPVTKASNIGYDTGVRKRLTSGGELTISQGLQVNNNRSPDLTLQPDPARLANLDITLGQPLLRGFGADTNLAEVHLAQNFERDAI